MNKNRLEAFSDGVLAIIIMVLELDVPEEPTWHALFEQAPAFFSYLLSFVYVGIYWNNHHHMLHLAGKINGTILWANLHLLFWLSLFPFTTHWMDQTGFVNIPVLVYGANLLLAAIAYDILEVCLVRNQGKDGALARALGRDWKGKVSPVIYLLGMGAAFVQPLISIAAYTVVAALWLIPDRRVERFLAHQNSSEG